MRTKADADGQVPAKVAQAQARADARWPSSSRGATSSTTPQPITSSGTQPGTVSSRSFGWHDRRARNRCVCLGGASGGREGQARRCGGGARRAGSRSTGADGFRRKGRPRSRRMRPSRARGGTGRRDGHRARPAPSPRRAVQGGSSDVAGEPRNRRPTRLTGSAGPRRCRFRATEGACPEEATVPRDDWDDRRRGPRVTPPPSPTPCAPISNGSAASSSLA